MFENFTPLSALAGGVLIGTSATLLMALNGRIAGICGILAAVLTPRAGDTAWRVAFLAGLVVAGLGGAFLAPQAMSTAGTPGLPVVVVAGLLVGFGTRLGNGCTSGHGVCGISRGSIRSVVATCVFMATAGVTVYLTRHVWGAA